jgi:hypothetical protein
MLIDNPLNESVLTFPILECFHILGFALSIGTIAIADFSMLGIGMVRQRPAELSRDTAMWTMSGLVLILFTGLGLFSSDPDMYYLNLAFVLKMTAFLLAVIFNYTIRRKVLAAAGATASGRSGAGKAVACISLALWACVLFGGIFIGFISAGLGFFNS